MDELDKMFLEAAKDPEFLMSYRKQRMEGEIEFRAEIKDLKNRVTALKYMLRMQKYADAYDREIDTPPVIPEDSGDEDDFYFLYTAYKEAYAGALRRCADYSRALREIIVEEKEARDRIGQLEAMVSAMEDFNKPLIDIWDNDMDDEYNYYGEEK